MLKQDNMVYLGDRNTRDCVSTNQTQIHSQHFYLFQMACILQPKYNILHGFFQCHLPVETVDVEVRITSMQGMHTFRRDRTCQLIKCNLWNTRLCPHPTIIKKMRTYLGLEGKLGPKCQPQTNQFRPPLPNTNPQQRKESKATEKRNRRSPIKKFKAVDSSNFGNLTVQPPKESAPINPESQQLTTLENSPPPLEDAPVCAGTPWPGARKMSGNHFEIRKDWPVPPSNNAPTNIIIKPKPPTIKTEPLDPNQPRPSPTATKQNPTATKQKRCGWGLNCPICKNAEEDWDGVHQRQLQKPDGQQKYPPQGQDTKQAQDPQHDKNYKLPQGQHSQISFDVPDRYAEQIHLRKE